MVSDAILVVTVEELVTYVDVCLRGTVFVPSKFSNTLVPPEPSNTLGCPWACAGAEICFWHVCMDVCVYELVYIYIYVCVCVYVCMYNIYICVYVCM